jgi:formiminotetrahydrofolate cyclodeaminase
MIAESSIEIFLDSLASDAPTPGGGSAAAVMGAVGAALVSMVCNVSIGKKGYEGIEAEILAVLTASEALRLQLVVMIAKDVTAFDSLMTAYKLPKTTEQDRARRSATIQSSLRCATEVPLECARLCAAVITLAQRAAEHGYRGVVSDAGVGVLAAYAALRGAALNVHINVPALQDRQFAERSKTEIDALVASGGFASEAVYTLVRNKLEA